MVFFIYVLLLDLMFLFTDPYKFINCLLLKDDRKSSIMLFVINMIGILGLIWDLTGLI